MKDAQYYIDLIIDGKLNDDEWLALEKEVDEWWNHAPKEEQDLYSESGYGESLYMVCSGIRYMRDPANSDIYYWRSNQEWFVEDLETMTVRLTEKAPSRAVESFQRWKEKYPNG